MFPEKLVHVVGVTSLHLHARRLTHCSPNFMVSVNAVLSTLGSTTWQHVYNATSKTPSHVHVISYLAYCHVFVPKVNILSACVNGFEHTIILLECVLEMYSFSLLSVDHIKWCRLLDLANPGRLNSIMISSIYGLDYPVLLRTAYESR
jgi:hypothetical protein